MNELTLVVGIGISSIIGMSVWIIVSIILRKIYVLWVLVKDQFRDVRNDLVDVAVVLRRLERDFDNRHDISNGTGLLYAEKMDVITTMDYIPFAEEVTQHG